MRAGRASGGWMSPHLVKAVMIDKGLDPTDRPSFARVQWKVRDTLTRLNKRGLHAFGRRGPWRPLADR